MPTESERPLPPVPPEQLGDVLVRAEELHDAAVARDTSVSLAEIEAVAAELGIDPAYVDDAIHALDKERAAAAELALEVAASRRRQLRRVGTVVVVALALVGLVMGGLGVQGRRAALAADAVVTLSARSLDEVLDRQADLTPQLLALAGGDPGALRARADAVRAADDPETGLAAARELNAALAGALGSLPTADGDAAAQQRLNLHHEVTGTWARIEAASRRYREATASREAVDQTLSVRVATGLGWVE